MTRSSKRKTAKSSQEVVPQDCKENSPSILSQSTLKRVTARQRNLVSLKENNFPSIPRKQNSNGVNSNQKIYSPVRKSARSCLKSSGHQNTLISNNVSSPRLGLSDKTNISKTKGNGSIKQASTVLRSIENKNNIVEKVISPTVPHPKTSSEVSSCLIKGNIENHVPVYKAVGVLDTDINNENTHDRKDEAVYEFEVDENEEPLPKKKRKKRPYVRKPKIGPKALTINNIKYSSTESLVSLPEKTVARKKKAAKTAQAKIKPYSSVTNLNDTEDTCYSVKSFMSHPPSVILCENNVIRPTANLSVLQETQSESCQSPVQLTANEDLHKDTPVNLPVPFYSSNWHNVHFSPNPRCYVSKTNFSNSHNNGSHGSFGHTSVNNSLPPQSSWVNASHASHDFLSSTPCKRTSLVVQNNSVFDNTYDLPRNLRPSTGFITDALVEDNSTSDHCFGFDEPEELEEPLVSPIKKNIDLGPRKVVKVPQELQSYSKDDPKPSAREVIEMLKATLPKATTKESTVFDMSGHSNSSSPKNFDKVQPIHPTVKHRVPPRRSYERQRRIRHHSEDEWESEEEKVAEEEKENVPKEVKKCYKKINASKASKPTKVPKAKQKIAKEEEEMERLAAQMNAQFQEIEKVNLLVE